MKLFPRLFLSHLAAVGVALAAVLALGLALDRWSYQVHLADVLQAAGVIGAEALDAIERGHRRALLLSFGTAAPLAVAFAAATSYRQSQRVAAAARALVTASQEVAAGTYEAGTIVAGQGELSEIGEGFDAMAAVLARIERERLSLITAVAHEVRTPLAALQSYAEALADGVLPADVATAAIRREAAALGRMANDLLLVARVEAGSIEVRPAAHDPGDLLRHAADRFSAAFETVSVRLEVEVAAGLPSVWADAERIQQVLSNLLSNALRYTPAGGQVRLSAEAGAGTVVFSTADTGPGVAREHRDRVFERFYLGDQARTRGPGGTGVGLAVSKGLVEAMGGRIWLESGDGGAVFRFALPTQPSPPRRPDRRTAARRG